MQTTSVVEATAQQPSPINHNASTAPEPTKKSTPAAVEPRPAAPASADQVLKAISDLQNSMEMLNRKINFEVDKGSGRFHVKIVDTTTDKIIREIPPEQVLKIAARMKELIGLLFDETV